MVRLLASLLLCGLLTACGSSGGMGNAPTGPSAAPPKFTGVKVGKPYCIAGTWYQPAYDPTYDKTGTASWYGPGFNGKSTANGEMFNQYDLTAAHPTLPMPCFVKVTNLDNGKTATVRVNDRGPFHSGRIIDLSKAAAEKLGVIATGTAKVRVQYLAEETEIYVASNGKIWPDELNASSQFAQALMPRETMNHSSAQDDAYYQIKDEFIPAPLEIADNNGTVVESVPVLSVEKRDLLPPVIAPAVADEAPYPSAREMEAPQEDAYAREMQAARGISGSAPAPEAALGPAKPWAAQVASFAMRENAEQLMQKLTPLGQPELQPVLIDGREWFRVYLHPAPGQPQEELISSLQKIGLRDARIVQ